jgi:hypothetical protein
MIYVLFDALCNQKNWWWQLNPLICFLLAENVIIRFFDQLLISELMIN